MEFFVMRHNLGHPIPHRPAGVIVFQGPQLRALFGTIHLRGRQIFTILTPTPLPSAFQQNAYEGDF